MGAPADFTQRELAVCEVDGRRLLRIHHASYGPIYYGASGGCRFDSPDGAYGVLYAAEDLGVAIAETLVRDQHRKARGGGPLLIREKVFSERMVSYLEADEPLRVAQMTGFPLLSLGGDASELQRATYDVTQEWSAGVHGHPRNVDGFIYQSRYVNTHNALAVFERGGNRVNLRCREAFPLLEVPGLAAILDLMNVAII